MTSSFSVAVLLLLFAEGSRADCGDGFRCVPPAQCKKGRTISYPCSEGGADDEDGICCPLDTNVVVPRTPAFPSECGFFDDDNRISGGEVASIGQFPWMALLGYKTEGFDDTIFLCGGSLITTSHVLTAAHCIGLDHYKLVLVRFGEWDTTTEEDCEVLQDSKVCGEPHKDVPVLKVTTHRKYNSTSLKNDIALIKLQSKVVFTDFIQPICLPFDMVLRTDMFYDKYMTISGWGKTSHGNLGGSNKLLFARIRVWPKDTCGRSVPPAVRPIKDKQICANGPGIQDACKGDSGGPLFNSTVLGSKVKNFQFGIVSFAAARTCGNPEIPTIYTRVDAYLSWIVKNAK